MAQKFYLAMSGGLDSTVLAVWAKHHGFDVCPVFFDYGSKHGPYEMQAAKNVVKAILPNKELKIINLRGSGIFAESDSALLAKNDAEIPEKDYAQDGSLAATVVPGRNLLFASILASIAESQSRRDGHYSYMALAVHSGDHDLYPDCRPGFIRTLTDTIRRSTDGYVLLSTPFSEMSKAEIVSRGAELSAPFELTRSCYKGQSKACGKCGTCRERLDAFAKNGLKDPIEYCGIICRQSKR